MPRRTARKSIDLKCPCGYTLWADARPLPRAEAEQRWRKFPFDPPPPVPEHFPVSHALRGRAFGKWRDHLGDLQHQRDRRPKFRDRNTWTVTTPYAVASAPVPDEWLCECPSCGAAHHGRTRELLDLIADARRLERPASRITERRREPIPGCEARCCSPVS